MIKTVQVSSRLNSNSTSFKNRVYYPVTNLRGPDFKVCNDYIEFLKYYGKDSLAKIIMEKGYSLLCHRVSKVEKANATLYEDGTIFCDGTGESDVYVNPYRWYARLDKSTKTNQHTSNHMYPYYTYFIEFNKDYTGWKDDDFYIIVDFTVPTSSSAVKIDRRVGIFGSGYIRKKGSGDWKAGKDKILGSETLIPTSLSKFLPEYEIDNYDYIVKGSKSQYYMESKIISFLVGAGLEVIDLGNHVYTVSTDSPTNIQFNPSDYDMFNFIKQDDSYVNRSQSRSKRSSRVLSISSKYPDATSSVHVDIVRSSYDNEKIIINVNIDDSSYSEHITTTMDRLLGGYLNSSIINIDYISENIDLTNKVTLTLNTHIPGYYNNGSYIDSLTNILEDENVIIPQADICVDRLGTSKSCELLNKIFPYAVILSTYNGSKDSSGKDLINTLTIYPDRMISLADEVELPSTALILDMIPNVAMYSREYMMTEDFDKSESSAICEITEEPLGIKISSVSVNSGLDMCPKYPILPAIAKATVYRICTDVDGLTSKDDIENYITNSISRISDLLNIGIDINISGKSCGSSYTGTVYVKIEGISFTQFTINAEIIYE